MTLGKRWSAVAVIVVAITVVLGIGATKVEFATGQDSYLNPDSQTAIDNREFQGKFGGETVILLFSGTDDSADVSQLFEGENLRTLGEITEGLGEIPGVEAVVTPLVSITFSDALVGGVPGDRADDPDGDGTGPGGDALLRAHRRRWHDRWRSGARGFGACGRWRWPRESG